LGHVTYNSLSWFVAGDDCFRVIHVREIFRMKLQTGVLPSLSRIIYNENNVGTVSSLCDTDGVVSTDCPLCELGEHANNDHAIRLCPAVRKGRSLVLQNFGLFLSGVGRPNWAFDGNVGLCDKPIEFSERRFIGEDFLPGKNCRSSCLVIHGSGTLVHQSWLFVLSCIGNVRPSITSDGSIVIDQSIFFVVVDISI
jgi:hypothetical protein